MKRECGVWMRHAIVMERAGIGFLIVTVSWGSTDSSVGRVLDS